MFVLKVHVISRVRFLFQALNVLSNCVERCGYILNELWCSHLGIYMSDIVGIVDVEYV